MRRPDPSDPHGTESNTKMKFNKNDVAPVPEINGKAKKGHERANPIQYKEQIIMTKDSQPDNKEARMIKCNGQTPITEEGQNHNRNAKKHSIKKDNS